MSYEGRGGNSTTRNSHKAEILDWILPLHENGRQSGEITLERRKSDWLQEGWAIKSMMMESSGIVWAVQCQPGLLSETLSETHIYTHRGEERGREVV